MARKSKLTLVVAISAVVVVVVVMFFLCYRMAEGPSQSVGWGRGKLKESEKAYYMSRVSRIIESWQETDRYADKDRDGRIKEPCNTYLVIDTTKPAAWIESNGHTDQDKYCDLPRRMKWKVYRSAPGDNSELSDKVRLKIRGIYTKRVFPEMIYLVGERSSSEHISFDFNSSSRGTDYGTSKFVLSPYKAVHINKGDFYGSIVVGDMEYERYRKSPAGFDAEQYGDKSVNENGKSIIADNFQNWLKIEKRLYQQIEREVMQEGFELRDLEVETGPDYTAAHAELRAGIDSVIRSFFGGYRRAEAYLKIDYLGDDVWYAKSGPHTRRPGPRQPLDLEFLVRPSGDVPRSERSKWLEMGRKKQQAVIRPASQWVVTLANGVTVEFIGICENPSGGKKWWGPDGRLLGYSPYFNAESYGRKRDERKRFEIAWKINFPKNARGGGTTSSLEGCKGSSYHQIHDKYGNDIHNIHAEGYAFEKSREKTTWKAGLKVGDEDYQWVTFKNISLVRGKDFGFNIELGN